MAKKKTPRRRLRQASNLRRALANAQGRSEFVIAIFVDVRGFSKFSQQHESPDTAMFIKRFYLQLMDEYFSEARFYKPTGDGLLITFPYDDKTLSSVAEKLIDACMRCLIGFPNICEGDRMINSKCRRILESVLHAVPHAVFTMASSLSTTPVTYLI